MNVSEPDGLTPEDKKIVDETVAKIRSAVTDTSNRFGARVIRQGAKILRGRRVRNQGFMAPSGRQRLYS